MPEMIAMLGNAPTGPLISDLSPAAKEAIQRIMATQSIAELDLLVPQLAHPDLKREWPTIVVFVESRRKALAKPAFPSPFAIVGLALGGAVAWHFWDRSKGGSGFSGFGAPPPAAGRRALRRSGVPRGRGVWFDKPQKPAKGRELPQPPAYVTLLEEAEKRLGHLERAWQRARRIEDLDRDGRPDYVQAKALLTEAKRAAPAHYRDVIKPIEERLAHIEPAMARAREAAEKRDFLLQRQIEADDAPMSAEQWRQVGSKMARGGR